MEKEYSEMTKKKSIEIAENMNAKNSELKNREMRIKSLDQELSSTIERMEVSHREQLLSLYKERDRVTSEIEDVEQEEDLRVQIMNDEFETECRKEEENYNTKRLLINKMYREEIAHLKSDQQMFNEALKQTEEEYKENLDITKMKKDEELNQLKTEGDNLRTRNSKLRKDNLKNIERGNNLKNLIDETEAQNNQLDEEISEFDANIQKMKNRLKGQERLIKTKEDRIKDFRRKNNHLQNYKSVYDYEVNTLKEEHEPLSEYVDNLEVALS